MDAKFIWTVLEECSEILFSVYGNPATGKAAQELSLPPDYFHWAAAIWLFDANLFTVTQFMRYFPYGLAQVNEEHFASAVRQGYLSSDGQGHFHATEIGKTVATRLIQAGHEVIAALTPLPKETLQALGDLLARISDAAMEAPEPRERFLITAKKNLYQRMDIFPTLEGFLGHCLELEGFRDDCYFATWSAYRVDGHTWEALDMLSRGESLTFANLHKKLNLRCVPEDVHARDVNELIRLGWVEVISSWYQITSSGKQTRDEVESETDRLFFASWSVLNEADLGDLACFAVRMRDGLRK
ncbi:MAG: hypothetical protein HY835_12445 [Anaerolineae bacterium]|nr:hypothetical protein [Anaerolineae bacterium]